MRYLAVRHLIGLAGLVAALSLVGTASAGGWATVGVSSQPAGMDAGDTWKPEITVLQHGRTPLGGLTPVVTIRDAQSGDRHDFLAQETTEVGIYEAEVVFPETGDWNVVVESGFGDSRLTFGPVAIGEAPSGGALPESIPVLPVGLVALLVAALAVAALVFRRRWRPTALPH